MNPAYKPLAWTAAAIAVGIVMVLAIRGLGGDDAAPSAPPAEAAAAAVIEDEPAAPAPPPSAAPAPWEQAQAPAAPASAIGALFASQPAPSAVANPTDAAASIASIREQSSHNVSMIDGLMRELDALEQSGKASPDMQLGALRDNLAVARRAQILALEMAESTQQPDTPARRQRTSEIVAELQQLQGKLRYDLAPAGLPGADRTP